MTVSSFVNVLSHTFSFSFTALRRPGAVLEVADEVVHMLGRSPDHSQKEAEHALLPARVSLEASREEA